MKTKMNVKEVSEKDFNLLLNTKLDVLWEQQKGEPYFYLAHKEKIVKIFAVLSENECKSGILYKSFTFVEDECVGFIPMDEATMKTLMTQIGQFNVTISYKEPESENELASVNCIMPNNSIDYYTIQVSKVLFKAFTITFEEL